MQILEAIIHLGYFPGVIPILSHIIHIVMDVSWCFHESPEFPEHGGANTLMVFKIMYHGFLQMLHGISGWFPMVSLIPMVSNYILCFNFKANHWNRFSLLGFHCAKTRRGLCCLPAAYEASLRRADWNSGLAAFVRSPSWFVWEDL